MFHLLARIRERSGSQTSVPGPASGRVAFRLVGGAFRFGRIGVVQRVIFRENQRGGAGVGWRPGRWAGAGSWRVGRGRTWLLFSVGFPPPERDELLNHFLACL